MSDKITVETDPVLRKDFQHKLFLYVVGLRDILFLERVFDELSGEDFSDLSGINTSGKIHAFIICYGRIFHHNTLIGKVDYNLIKPLLTKEEVGMHKYLMEIRNKYYAHNDIVGIQLLVHFDNVNKKITAMAMTNYHYLSEHKNVIIPLLKKLKKHFEEQRDELLSQLYSSDNGWQINTERSVSLNYYSGIVENTISVKKGNE